MERRRLIAAVALALVLAGCGSSDDGSDAGTGGDEPGATTETAAGTELGDGIAVPDGAELAGVVFRRPADPFAAAEPLPPVEEVPETITPPELGSTTSTPSTPATSTAPATPPDPDEETWTALLTIDGDPFTIWDDLAARVRDAGLPIGGSAESCRWAASDGSRAPVADGEPTFRIGWLDCDGSAASSTRLVSISLRSGGESPGTIRVEAGPAQWTTPPEDTTPVDDAARDLLPEPAAPEEPAPGDPFGGEGNCFDAGYTRFPLPDGATLVATEGGPDGTSVLAVDDIDGAIRSLEAAAYAGDDVYTPAGPRDLPVSDGATVSFGNISIDAGGGACELLGSPDGRFLLITMYSD